MSNDCCNERPNFGHPACIEDLGGVSRFIFVGAPFDDNLNVPNGVEYFSILENFLTVPDKDIWRAFPQVQNFVWTPAESQFEEASNGKKSFIKNGKISIACETWDKDATAKIVGKMQALRCSSWGVYLVTDSNKLIGSTKKYSAMGTEFTKILPIKIDEQSIEALFQFKTDATAQKVMFSFDLARNFDVSTLYAIDGDLIWDADSESIKPIDFNEDLPNAIDCSLITNGSFTTTGGLVVINDDYRQGNITLDAGDTLGNVTGLVIENFLVTNETDNTTITPTSVTEAPIGSYEFVIPAQSSNDVVKITLVDNNPTSLTGQIVYRGSLKVTV